jgi:hypothetical protein
VPWFLFEGQRKMLANFGVVIGVASVPGTWQNKQLPNVLLSHNNHKRDPRKEYCIHYFCGQDCHSSRKKVGWVQPSASL